MFLLMGWGCIELEIIGLRIVEVVVDMMEWPRRGRQMFL